MDFCTPHLHQFAGMWMPGYHPPHHTQTSMDSCALPFTQFVGLWMPSYHPYLNVFLY